MHTLRIMLAATLISACGSSTPDAPPPPEPPACSQQKLLQFDPGTAWTGGGLSTLDYVLQRRCTVTTGDINGMDAFDPSTEWTGAAYSAPASSHSGLGNRSECP